MPNATPGQVNYEAFCAFWSSQGLSQEALFAWSALTPEMQAAWEACAQAVAQQALTLAVRYGQIDGDHHKAWVIDQMVRALLGSDEAYRQFVADACTGDEGPQTYEWNEGIAP